MTEPYYADSDVTLHHGKAEKVLATLPDASVDAVVCDPPYGLEFMGKDWDSFRPSSAAFRSRVDGRTNPSVGKSVTVTPESYVAGQPFQRWCEEWARECLRVLKPGGFMLAFGGTRTVHRLTCAVEDAGFEIRDGIDWIYGNGFPKSLDVSKSIDKLMGAEREVVGRHHRHGGGSAVSGSMSGPLGTAGVLPLTAPVTDDAARLSGWGTALKPAREPIVVARKPLVGTVAGNVLAFGTGALNIDACRVEGRERTDYGLANATRTKGGTYGVPSAVADFDSSKGRWPSNLVLSHAATDDGADLCGAGCVPGCPVMELDGQSGASTSRSAKPRGAAGGDGWRMSATGTEYDDHGGPSRFFPVFRYEAKAPSSERPTVGGVAHPTVKPLALMRWLVRLVTPGGGLVLDPFAGSGTTAEACVLEGFRCVAIEQDAQYLPLITSRLAKPVQAALFGLEAA